MLVRLDLPSWQSAADDAARTRRTIDRWAASSQLAELVRAFGASPPALGGEPLLEWLDRFAAAHWDFRAGAERNLAPRVALPAEVERLVFDSAPVLGLAGPYPLRRDSYDTIVMTGGMVRAGIVKPRFARELLEAGITVRNVVFLGGFRPFAGDELTVAPLLGVEGANEFDAMVRGMELAFGPLGAPAAAGTGSGDGNQSWRVLDWDLDGVRLQVVAAPSSVPSRRANTADTYRFWADRVRDKAVGEEAVGSVLVVTTPIYVPYQGAGAVEILGLERGLAVETIGTSKTASELGKLTQRFLAQNHLQELRAAIGAMRQLRAKLAADPEDH